MTIEVGSVLCGKYELEASIGKGGMGEVFAATHLETAQRVAIKVVSRGTLGDLLVQRLHREAIAASRVRSAYVPQLLDVARDETGELFLVMELLHGETLAERLRRVGGFLPWEEVRWIGEHVLLGLIDAHAAGVVHRDLKPGNIFIEARAGEERGKILDFGVCKLDSQDVEHLTTTGEALGTIAYMAPEQIRGASRVDERADLYSFAMVIFEALSARLAYDGSGQMALIASKLERSARSLRDFAQVNVPAGLDLLLARALARKPAERFASAQEVLRAWRALGPPIVAPRAIPIQSGAPMMMQTETAMSTVTVARGGGGAASRIGLAVASAALVAATALLAFILFARQRTVPAPRDETAARVADAVASAPPAASAAPDPRASEPAVARAPALDGVDVDALPAVDAGPPRPPTRSGARARPRTTVPSSSKKKDAGPHIQEQPRY